MRESWSQRDPNAPAFRAEPSELSLPSRTHLRRPAALTPVLKAGREAPSFRSHAQTRFIAHRDNGRLAVQSEPIARAILERLRPLVPHEYGGCGAAAPPTRDRLGPLGLAAVGPCAPRLANALTPGFEPRRHSRQLCACNPNIRLYKYVAGQRFGPHVDQSNQLTDGGATEFTVLLYLGDDGLEGGDTIFCDRRGTRTPSLPIWSRTDDIRLRQTGRQIKAPPKEGTLAGVSPTPPLHPSPRRSLLRFASRGDAWTPPRRAHGSHPPATDSEHSRRGSVADEAFRFAPQAGYRVSNRIEFSVAAAPHNSAPLARGHA